MSWIEEEFVAIDIGDCRLNKRAMKIADVLSLAPGKTIPQAFRSRADITDLPIDTFPQIELVVRYYLCRWEIETFFKVLKSGCKIEERQLQIASSMKNLISLFIILAWRIIYTIKLGRVCSEMSSGDLFEEAEWKSVCKIFDRKKPLPRKPPPLGEFIIMIATLGGYVRQKNGGTPGVKTVWAGMARMLDFAIAWEAFGS